MLEILAPAGSPEGVVAAVQNGADAVYLGFGGFNARRNAKNFTAEEFRNAAEYCRMRGVKTYVTLNTLATDREMDQVAEHARLASRLGADAVLVQDLGVMQVVRQAAPDLPVHASTQMSVHNLEGVRLAAAMGATRVVLARELSRREIERICAESPIEIEVFVHGALCMCYSGQCYMSAVIGRRSGNRGLCAQPCRLNYSATGHDAQYLLSLKDSCLVRYLDELEKMGVRCIKIEGRMRRPEYAAIVTGVYSRAIKEKKPPTRADMQALQAAFSRQGFTDGYYRDRKGPEMFGVREEGDKGNELIFATARKNYINGKYQRIPVRFAARMKAGEPAKLAGMDDRQNIADTEGMTPEPAIHREMTPAMFATQLHKTGGTPFVCAGVKSEIEPGLSLPASAINEMRREVLSALLEKRRALPERREGDYAPHDTAANPEAAPVLNVQLTRARQLSRELFDLKPHILYFPLEELSEAGRELWPFLDSPEVTVCAVMPRVIHDPELDDVSAMLRRASGMGIGEALVGNLGQIQFARSHGFAVRGDFGLNIFNSHAMQVVRDLGLISQTLSFELRLEQIRDIAKLIPAELIAYGRLPLMITENCIVKNVTRTCACDNFSGISDRMGAIFPVMKAYGCRNTVLNSKKLFLADKRGDTSTIGLWAERLFFTTENSAECVQVLRRYMGLEDYEPVSITRGLYYRGVE